MTEYGSYAVLEDGALRDPELRRAAIGVLMQNARLSLARANVVNFDPIEILENPHVRFLDPDTSELTYHDTIAWRTRAE